MTKTELSVIEWLANGNTGGSSETMAYWLAFGVRVKNMYTPCDVHDLSLCFGLLRAAPELSKKIPQMAELSKLWANIASNWSWLEEASILDVSAYLRKPYCDLVGDDDANT